jgi:hypothetical protein
VPVSCQEPAPPEARVESNVPIDLIDELEVRKIVGGTKPNQQADTLPNDCGRSPLAGRIGRARISSLLAAEN